MKPRNISDPEGLKRFGIGKPENFSFMNTAEFTVYLLTVTTSISFIFNIYVVFQLAKDKFIKNITDLEKKKILTQDIKLAAYTLIVFASDLIYCVQQYIKKASINDQSFVFNIHVQVAIADITVLTPIWFMILSNQTLQKNIVATFFACNLLNNVTPVTSLNS
uniref:7TM GPCR serpentine receptor class x (Srx) domain-containing protein n=1 Tax=Panagrolaimus davidi TaxID=227884 RepID=A0A914QIQ2_9BILA